MDKHVHRRASLLENFSRKVFNQRGKQKKLPRRPLVLCSNLPNDHGNFDEVYLQFKTKFRKKGFDTPCLKYLCICLYKF